MKFAAFALVLVLAAIGCGATVGQVDDILKIDQSKTTVYADVAQTLANLVEAVDSAVEPTSGTHAKMVETRAYLAEQNDRYEQLARDAVAAVMSMQELPPEKRQAYLETIFAIIAKIKTKNATTINNLEFDKPATP